MKLATKIEVRDETSPPVTLKSIVRRNEFEPVGHTVWMYVPPTKEEVHKMYLQSKVRICASDIHTVDGYCQFCGASS